MNVKFIEYPKSFEIYNYQYKKKNLILCINIALREIIKNF